MLNRVLDFFRPKRAPAEPRCDSQTFNAALRHFPVLRDFSAPQRERLLERAADIVAQKTFLGGGGYEPSREDCLSVAVLAALPVLHRGLDWYQDFHTFVLYPQPFVTDLEETDDDGLVHSGRDLRVGEAWNRGPVILAMSDVHASGQGDGFNVVVHELAHQIDHRNGEANGFPPLPDGMEPKTWTRVFSSAYDRLLAELERGEETGLDPYAAESPAEFFAVVSECFFDAPRWLKAHHPDIHGQLVALYGYSP